MTLEPFNQYDRLLTFAQVLDDAHLDHTLVFQIDEFWCVGDKKAVFDLTSYWTTAVAVMQHSSRGETQVTRVRQLTEEDPLGIYLPHHRWYESREHKQPCGTPEISSRIDVFDGKPETTLYRWNFFVEPKDGGQPSGYDRRSSKHQHESDLVYRIPYLWDFGILLVDRELWKRYKDVRVGEETKKRSIAQIWNTLCRVNHDALKLSFRDTADASSSDAYPAPIPGGVSWSLFLEACRTIAEMEDLPAFDVDLSTVETFSCWVFELWASIERKANKANYREYFSGLTEHGGPTRRGLQMMLQKCGGSLFQCWHKSSIRVLICVLKIGAFAESTYHRVQLRRENGIIPRRQSLSARLERSLFRSAYRERTRCAATGTWRWLKVCAVRYLRIRLSISFQVAVTICSASKMASACPSGIFFPISIMATCQQRWFVTMRTLKVRCL